MKEVVVESVSSPNCHNCRIFEEFWHSIESQYPNVKYRNISVIDSEGAEMASRYGIFVSPGIIINGELFSVGGVDKDKFTQKIKELSD